MKSKIYFSKFLGASFLHLPLMKLLPHPQHMGIDVLFAPGPYLLIFSPPDFGF